MEAFEDFHKLKYLMEGILETVDGLGKAEEKLALLFEAAGMETLRVGGALAKRKRAGR